MIENLRKFLVGDAIYALEKRLRKAHVDLLDRVITIEHQISEQDKVNLQQASLNAKEEERVFNWIRQAKVQGRLR